MPPEFIWIMFVMKIPLAMLLYIVWYACQEPEPADQGDDGGTKTRESPHPRRPEPRGPRRGPHGEAPLPSPPRVRAKVARARQHEH